MNKTNYVAITIEALNKLLIEFIPSLHKNILKAAKNGLYNVFVKIDNPAIYADIFFADPYKNYYNSIRPEILLKLELEYPSCKFDVSMGTLRDRLYISWGKC